MILTAEVAIINRFGIALAADSAVTIGNERVWKSTNKLFSLGPNSDIAIMIYGGGDFIGVPWEIIIKSFREFYGNVSFEHVSECREKFRDFLKKPEWSSDFEEDLSFAGIIVKELEELNQTISPKTSKEFRKELEDWIGICEEQIKEKEVFDDGLKLSDFRNHFSGYVDKFCSDIFKKHVPKSIKKKLEKYLFEYLRRKDCASGYQTGVVFAGYGEEEHYPVILELIVDGRCNGFLRAWHGRTTDLNKNRQMLATVIPFAQRDMTNVFMEGVSSAYLSFFFNLISGILDRKTKYLLDNFMPDADAKLVEEQIQKKENKGLLKDIGKAFERWRAETAIDPLMDSIRSLPREEMAAMAEALVELTSLRRKIDSHIQSVAGPVDVAFISKGDGLVWMKRKHYFDPEINNDFFSRKKARQSVRRHGDEA